MKITLKKMAFHAFHGWYPEERKAGNHFELDVSILMDSSNYKTEDIDSTINYQSVYDLCRSEMENPRKLLETVVESIAKRIIEEYELAQSVEVCLRKVSVQLGGDLDYAEICHSI